MNPDSICPCPNCGRSSHAVRFVEPPFFIVRCVFCSLTYLGNPPDDSFSVDSYYDTPEPESESYRSGGPDFSLARLYEMNRFRMRLILSVKPKGRLLDVGCGRGFFLKTASDAGFDARGIDLSEKAVHYARERLRVNAETADLESLVRSGVRFDAVTLWHVLEHFLEPVGVLKRIRSLLTDGGLCMIEVPNLHSLKFLLSRRKWQGGNHPLYHRTFFTASTLKMVLRKAGFSSVRRLTVAYPLPGRTRILFSVKRILDQASLDSFLDFMVEK